ncbi:two-component system response regulator [Nostoc sp. MBR 210]|uniref:Response regulator n=1 Tax=Nostoc spongiaeforme FACHB-130 TaxID=1357510 RepID=A0ABR8FYU9_9NOSO|nr:response regulator [Nostoc spongiaeforme]MBD2595555.1 response regulator [Nostoc spongiaeforme FACHB-130]OCQ98298.1 two-component system response regulator [Nostoc sp. MBR 210]
MTVNLLTINQQVHLNQLKRVLLIEDNHVNRMLLSDYLGYCGFNVKSLSNGTALFSTVNTFQPDLVLLDLKLPDIDGYWLLEQIQKHPYLSKIPVIVVSAFAFKADQERAIHLGARRYLVKPINLTALMMTIQEELACHCI